MADILTQLQDCLDQVSSPSPPLSPISLNPPSPIALNPIHRLPISHPPPLPPHPTHPSARRHHHSTSIPQRQPPLHRPSSQPPQRQSPHQPPLHRPLHRPHPPHTHPARTSNRPPPQNAPDRDPDRASPDSKLPPPSRSASSGAGGRVGGCGGEEGRGKAEGEGARGVGGGDCGGKKIGGLHRARPHSKLPAASGRKDTGFGS